MKGEPALDAGLSPQEPGDLQFQADAAVGRADRHQFPGRVLLSQAHRGQSHSWEDVPAEIKNTFDKLGIPEAEKKFLSGVKAQYESEVVYGSLREDLAKQGVIFTDTDSAVREHPDLLREYFSTIIPPTDNKFAALNSAVWSGGSFIYVPKGVEDRLPLAGLFPHQRGQHGPVRADADHRRRRRPGALRGRLHGPHVQHRKPALGRGRGDRQARLPRPLYDDPELGQQHLQPGDQAGRGLRRFAGGMGRRQPRQPLDDEVPGHLHDGAGRPRRSALRGLRFRTASTRTPGPRSSTAPRTRPAASSRSRFPRTAAGPAIAACARSCRGPRSRSPTSSATP